LAEVPLVGLLAAVAFVELIANRIFARLIRFDPLAPRSLGVQLIDGAARFAFELVSVLATLLLAAALARVALFGRGYRPGARLSFPLVGVVCVMLTALGLAVRLPPTFVFHLHLSFFFLALLVVLTVIASPVDVPLKLASLLLLGAYAFRLLPSMVERFSSLPGGLSQADANQIMLALFALASVALVPRRGGGWMAPAVTLAVVCSSALIIRLDWDTARRVAEYAFGLDLALSPWGQAVYLAALGFATHAILRLLGRPGLDRLRGWGLLLMALGGLQLDQPYQVALAALGLLCLAESAVRPDERALTRAAFEPIVRRGAATVQAPQVVISGLDGYESARFAAPSEARRPVTVTLRRRAGVVSEIEVAIGERVTRDPSFTVEHRRAGRLGPRAEGAEVLTDDAAFDGTFRVRDRRSVGAQLLDEPTRARMVGLVSGWLAIWPHCGLRYRAAQVPDGEDGLAQLLALLCELAERTS
jgi:hypothetical protein